MGLCVRVLTARFSGSIHCDFDGAVVSGDLRRAGEHRDGQSEALSCSTATCRRNLWKNFIVST